MKNGFYTPQNFLAKLSNGKIVSIDDYIKDNITDDISCPCCNSKLFLWAKDSIHKQPYFQHEKGGSCLDYTRNENPDRRDNFYRREMELTEQEVENYKERIEGLEYIYGFVKRIKNEKLTPENRKEFLTALSCLDYEDQQWVFSYAKNSSCLKSLKYEMADTINNSLFSKLNAKYEPLGIKISMIDTHRIFFEYKEIIFSAGKSNSQYYHQPFNKPLLHLDNEDLYKDFDNLERRIKLVLKYKPYIDYIYEHKNLFNGEIKIEHYYSKFSSEDSFYIKDITHGIKEKVDFHKPIQTQIIDIISYFNNKIKKQEISQQVDLYITSINNQSNFIIESEYYWGNQISIRLNSLPPIEYRKTYHIDFTDNYKIDINNICKDFTKEIENIINNIPMIPLTNVKVSEKDEQCYKIYAKNMEKEYIIILPKSNFLRIADKYYYYDTHTIFTNKHNHTLVLSRNLGDNGKFTTERCIDLMEFFPSQHILKSENKNNESNLDLSQDEFDDDYEI